MNLEVLLVSLRSGFLGAVRARPGGGPCVAIVDMWVRVKKAGTRFRDEDGD